MEQRKEVSKMKIIIALIFIYLIIWFLYLFTSEKKEFKKKYGWIDKLYKENKKNKKE